MDNGKLGFGLLVIFIGTFLLLFNYGLITWSFWWGYTYLWPLIIIALGIKMIFPSNKLASILPVLTIIAIPFIAQLNLLPDNNGLWNDNNGDKGYGKAKVHEFSWPMEGRQIKTSSIKIDSPTLNLELKHNDPEENQILIGKVPSNFGGVSVNGHMSNVNAKFVFESDKILLNSGLEKWVLGLSEEIIWDNITIDSGAISANLDFTSLKIEELDIDTGISDLKLFFGDNEINTKINLDTGVGNIEITTPDSVGLKVKLDTGIGNKILGNRQWIIDGNYRYTENYANAPTKLDIDASAGIGKIEIKEAI